MQLLSSRCSNLARNALVREKIGAVGIHVDYDSSVTHRHDIEKFCAWFCVDFQRKTSMVIGPEPKIASRAQHYLRDFSANRPLLGIQCTG